MERKRCIHYLLVITVYWAGLTTLVFYIRTTRHHVTSHVSSKGRLPRKYVRGVIHVPMADARPVVAMPMRENVSDNWEYEDVIIWNETKTYGNIQVAPFVNLEANQGQSKSKLLVYHFLIP